MFEGTILHEEVNTLPTGLPLDCELYDGPAPAGRYRCATALRYGGQRLVGLTLIVFDAPAAAGDYRQRLEVVERALADWPRAQVSIPSVWRLTGTEHARRLLAEVQGRGGEGLILRRPELKYRPDRSRDMLKMKSPYPIG